MDKKNRLNLTKMKGEIFHFIGIGGVSMSALSQMLLEHGFKVQGTDLSENDETYKLTRKGVKIFHEHSVKNLEGAGVVVYSSAIHEDNEELKAAREQGLTLVKRAELLGAIADTFKTVIAVSGSHGKTTATGMIAEMFDLSGHKPTYHIGGTLNREQSNYKIGDRQFFITEACEYMENFLYIYPDISVILNVDGDHLDYFKDLGGVKRAFAKFQKNTKPGGINILCYDDENSKELMQRDNVVTFGMDKRADLHAVNVREYEPSHYSFDVVFMKCKLGNIRLNMVGRHNILNALCAILVGIACAIDFCDIKQAIENFSGVERRCQKVAEIGGARIFHDYAHHPAQIKKMMQVAHDLTKNGGRICCVFEPHTFSRTKFLLEEFAESFSGADKLILAPVYSAREQESDGLNSFDLAKSCRKYLSDVKVIGSYDEIYDEILKSLKNKDVVMILGAGNIQKLARKFCEKHQ